MSRQEFQQVLKDALDQYHPYWQNNHRKDRPYKFPDAETLRAWIETEQHPQTKTFKEFLERSQFPEEVKQQLSTLYHRLPRRKHSRSCVTDGQTPTKRVNTKFIALLGIVLALLVIVILFFVFQSIRQPRTKTWCTANASAVQTVNDEPLLYFEGTLQLENFEIRKFYIFFDDEYVSGSTLSNQKLDVERQNWVWTIAAEWTHLHPQWQDTFLWRVDYEC